MAEQKLPTVSLCMIVRNEAENIRYCLNSVKDFVDEIIIVDTGSTDNTVEVCKEYTEKIYYFKWIDDFSAARNESIKYAGCDWILVLDGDEVIPEDSAKNLKKVLKKIPDDTAILYPKIYDITKDLYLDVLLKKEKLDFMRYDFSMTNRLFRNYLNLTYKYSLHEYIGRPEVESSFVDIKVLHYGYHEVSKERLIRNLQCSEKDLLKYPNDIHLRFGMARTLKGLGRIDEYVKIMEALIIDYIKQKPENIPIRLNEIYFYHIKYLIELKLSDLAQKNVFSWITRLKGNFDIRPYFYLGQILYLKKDYSGSRKIFQLVADSFDTNPILKKKKHFYYLIQRDAYFYLGTLFLMENEFSKALPYLKYVKEHFSQNNPSLDKLLSIALAGIKS